MQKQNGLIGEQLSVRYIPLDQVALWDDNPKKHDVPGIIKSISRYGFVDPPKFDPSLNTGSGGLVYGNGRAKCVKIMRDDPMRRGVPRGVCVDDDGAWYLPVIFGVDAESEAVANALAIDHNNLTMSGGNFDFWDFAKMWDQDEYMNVLKKLSGENVMPLTMTDDNLRTYLGVMEGGVMTREFDEDVTSGETFYSIIKVWIPPENAEEVEERIRELLSDIGGSKFERMA